MSKKDNERRPHVTAENYHLWAACGGVCSFRGCKNRIIVEKDGAYNNVGIKAHIIGHAKNSARHEYMEEYGYTQETLEDVSNIMYLCYEHSKIVDDKHTKVKYPPDVLFKMKEEHEKRVAAWAVSDIKNSIALIHKRFGGPSVNIEYEDIPPYLLIDVVDDEREFNDFTKEGWSVAEKDNENLYKLLIEKMKAHDVKVVEVFPLSPIPLLIHFGSLLSDSSPYEIYQYDREAGVWVRDNCGPNSNINITCDTDIMDKENLAVSISISGRVKRKSIVDILEDKFDLLSIEIDEPGIKRVLYREDVMKIQIKIKEEIEKLLQEQDYKKIHLFYAGPAGLAIEIGRGINKNIWSEVCLYQYNNRAQPQYQYALSI